MKFSGQELNHEFLKNADEQTLKNVCQFLREEIIKIVSEKGGHLSSNLGIVDLTVGLIRNFDPFVDDIIFDVGHQTYAYKMLTGRDLSTLRELDGIAPFSSREESKADRIDNGHSSTSLSIAIGMAKAKELANDNSYTVAVIGDGSITNGLSFEALNQIASLKNDRLIIVLNDNEMAISKTSGSVANRLSKIRTMKFYLNNVISIKKLDKSKATRWIYYSLRGVKNFFKKFIVKDNLFDALDIDYNGTFDGNNIKEINKAFTYAKKLTSPILLHFKTKKGLGYKYALEDSNGSWHGIAPFNIETGVRKTPSKEHLTDYVAEEVYNILKRDEKAYLISAAMMWGAHLSKCFEDFPLRTIDVGIAEEHAITLAAGLALKGYHPIVSIYSTFLQRSYDEVLHDLARQKLGVLVLVERSGLVGKDGSSHQGIYDVNFISSIPNTMIYHPSSKDKMGELLNNSDEFFNCNHPTFIRISHENYEEGRSEFKNTNKDKLLITYGQNGYKLGKAIENDFDVLLLEKIHPLNKDNLNADIASYKEIVIYDAYSTELGFSSELILLLNKLNNKAKVTIYALPNDFIPSGSIDELLERYKLLPEQVKEAIINKY